MRFLSITLLICFLSVTAVADPSPTPSPTLSFVPISNGKPPVAVSSQPTVVTSGGVTKSYSKWIITRIVTIKTGTPAAPSTELIAQFQEFGPGGIMSPTAPVSYTIPNVFVDANLTADVSNLAQDLAQEAFTAGVIQ